MGTIKDLFEDISPSELSKARGKRQDTSTRDKRIFLKRIEELEKLLEFYKCQIIIKKNE